MNHKMKMHMRSPDLFQKKDYIEANTSTTQCGNQIKTEFTTDDKSKVTCKVCLKAIRGYKGNPLENCPVCNTTSYEPKSGECLSKNCDFKGLRQYDWTENMTDKEIQQGIDSGEILIIEIHPMASADNLAKDLTEFILAHCKKRNISESEGVKVQLVIGD